MKDESIPAPPRDSYIPDEIILYGVQLNDANGYARIDVGLGSDTQLQLNLDSPSGITASIVLAYGYAFDGHCYRLDSNRIFLVRASGKPAVGGGFDEVPGYRMWRIKSTTQILEIATNFGDARSIILDAQLPGKRSPSSYAITLRMAHRDGRLTRD